MIAELNGPSYQPLIHQILNRFADCEKKKLLQEAHSEKTKKILHVNLYRFLLSRRDYQ